jgi:GGDEF domain-containing protein
MPFDGSRPFEGLEPRIAWTQALARENARHQRYGRSASIVVFEARPLSEVAAMDGWMERVAGPIAHTIKRDARATDLITRSADARFQVLLPETTEAEAVHFADRVISDCGVWLGAIRAPVGVRAAASATHGDLTLEDALIRAIEALARD